MTVGVSNILSRLIFLAGFFLFIPLFVHAQTYTPESLHTGPYWSPDGNNIAFSAAYGPGGYNIYTVNLWTRDMQQVTDHPSNDLYPSWDPHGRNIAFYSDRENTVGPFPPDTVIYNVRGLYETYARDGYRPSWSPDGRTIIAHFRGEKGNYEIYTMNRRGLNRKPLTDNMATDVHPKLSPDGSKIVFVSDRDHQPEIYVMDVDGSNQTRLTHSTSYDLDPVWSPDGSQIAFISNRLGHFDIFVMEADGSNIRRLTNNPSFDISPVWSPDGERFFFRQTGMDSSICM
jgi:Tol biopolymer transport system component